MIAVSLGFVSVVNFLIGCGFIYLALVMTPKMHDVSLFGIVFFIGVIGAFAALCFWAIWGLLYMKRLAWIVSQVLGAGLFAFSMGWIRTIFDHSQINFGMNVLAIWAMAAVAIVNLILLNMPPIRRWFRAGR